MGTVVPGFNFYRGYLLPFGNQKTFQYCISHIVLKNRAACKGIIHLVLEDTDNV